VIIYHTNLSKPFDFSGDMEELGDASSQNWLGDKN
jgi:hypothetical protein